MPNWCENRLYIESTPEDIAAIKAAILNGDNDEQGLLNYLRPQPTYLEERAENQLPHWYTWRVDNWGTKWEVDAEIVSHSVKDGWINLCFDSAWSPPIGALYYWESEREGRSFNIRYIEWGMAFCGEADSNGLDETFSIPTTVADVKQTIPTDLDEEFTISETVAQWEQDELEAS